MTLKKLNTSLNKEFNKSKSNNTYLQWVYKVYKQSLSRKKDDFTHIQKILNYTSLNYSINILNDWFDKGIKQSFTKLNLQIWTSLSFCFFVFKFQLPHIREHVMFACLCLPCFIQHDELQLSPFFWYMTEFNFLFND